MDKGIINTEQLTREGKVNLFVGDYELELTFNVNDEGIIYTKIMKNKKDIHGNHVDFEKVEIKTLVEDLIDLSKWRHYKELKKDLNS